MARKVTGSSMFQSIVEASPNGVVLVDRSGRIVLVNREAERLFGYERAELLGGTIEQLVPERHRTDHHEARGIFGHRAQHRAMGGRDLVGLRKDGAEIPLEIGLSPIDLDGGGFVLASVVDASPRRRAEARFRAAVESAPSGMVMVDGRGVIVLANQEIERLFGYRRQELLGRSIELLVPDTMRERHPEQRAAFFRDPQRRAMGQGRDLFGRRKDGTEVPVEIGLNPIETEEGLFVLASVVDIGARKRFEEELRRSNEELGRFAYVASHDLQEPLRTVASYVQLIERRYGERLDGDARDFMGYVVDGVRRMQHLIEDLLTFSRVGTRGAPMVPTDPAAALQTALDGLHALIADTGARVTWDPLPAVLADRSQLEQLFANLIGNALKFRGATPPEVHVRARRDGMRWEFEVRDNGIGIEPQYFDRIFVIFQRLHGRDEYPGTGIGLAICKKIVERHGGRIWLESAPGRGAAFYFTLPAPLED